MKILHAVAVGLVPPLCAACGRTCPSKEVVCARCSRRLADGMTLAEPGPQGVDCVWSSAIHDGVARDLVTALKFRRLLPVADLMAEHMHWLAPGGFLRGSLVPVPSAPLRSLRRGFDPAMEIAAALSKRTGIPLDDCLSRRGVGRQVGRRRAQRIGDPPRIRARGEVPRTAVLIDDVFTTGATLTACARALRDAGTIRVQAVVFARRL